MSLLKPRQKLFFFFKKTSCLCDRNHFHLKIPSYKFLEYLIRSNWSHTQHCQTQVLQGLRQTKLLVLPHKKHKRFMSCIIHKKHSIEPQQNLSNILYSFTTRSVFCTFWEPFQFYFVCLYKKYKSLKHMLKI